MRTLFPENALVGPNETVWDMDESVLFHRSLAKLPTFRNWRQHLHRNYYPFMRPSSIAFLSKSFVPIRYLHLYDPIPIRTNLLCNILPNTPRSCQASLEEDLKGESLLAHMNAGQLYVDRIWYDQLATEAVDQNLVPASAISRKKLTDGCREYHEIVKNRTLFDLPHRCPKPQALLLLWKMSWETEKRMFGANQANRTLHVEIFRRNLALGKYCNIDAEKALEQKDWQDYFQSVTERKMKKNNGKVRDYKTFLERQKQRNRTDSERGLVVNGDIEVPRNKK